MVYKTRVEGCVCLSTVPQEQGFKDFGTDGGRECPVP